jgi:hypothetical protein
MCIRDSAELRQHLDNANAKSSADGRQVRIVKRAQGKKIDAAVTLSMARARAAAVLPREVRVHKPAPVANRWRQL